MLFAFIFNMTGNEVFEGDNYYITATSQFYNGHLNINILSSASHAKVRNQASARVSHFKKHRDLKI